MLAQRRLPILLIALVALALFPFGWLGQQLPALGMWLNDAPLLGHIVGHATIFVVLGAALLACWPALLRRPIRYFALMLALAVGQELLQRSYKRFRITGDDLFDLGVDLLAAGAIFALARLWAGRAQKERP